MELYEVMRMAWNKYEWVSGFWLEAALPDPQTPRTESMAWITPFNVVPSGSITLAPFTLVIPTKDQSDIIIVIVTIN